MTPEIWRALRPQLPADLTASDSLPETGPGPHLYRLTGPTGPVLLKENSFLTPDRQTLFAEALAGAVEAGLHPPLHPFRDGTPVTGVGDRLFLLMPELSIRPFDRQTDLEAAAAVIARLHGLLAALQVPAGRSPMWAATPVVAEELEVLGRPDLATTVRETAEFATSRNIRLQVVHNDLHPGNLFRAGRVLYVTDLESLATNPLVADVLFAALRLTDGLRTEMERFLAAYRAAAPLTAEELACAHGFLIDDLARKLAFIHRRRAAGDRRFESDIGKYEMLLDRALELSPFG